VPTSPVINTPLKKNKGFIQNPQTFFQKKNTQNSQTTPNKKVLKKPQTIFQKEVLKTNKQPQIQKVLKKPQTFFPKKVLKTHKQPPKKVLQTSQTTNETPPFQTKVKHLQKKNYKKTKQEPREKS
jgi:hypothetical protein